MKDIKKINSDVPIDLQSKSDTGNTHSQVLRFYLKTYGCQMNVADSNLFADELARRGFVSTSNIDEAKIILFNTCTVRQHAEDRALSEIGRMKFWKKKNSDGLLVVAGCVAQRLGENIKKKFPFVDLVIGAKDIDQFPELIDECSGGYRSRASSATTYPVSRFVSISRGCNNFCSYCIVPYVRGQEKYFPAEKILEEIKCLVEKGTREVVLLGQNINSYKSFDVDFAGLLTEVNKIDGLERIRFLTSHPKDMSDRIIDAMAGLDKVCEHLHLPLQSGSTRILKLMNRKYSQEDYIELINKIRKKIPDISITTDLMVGFPAETDKDFSDTFNLVKSIKFDFAYVFKYSPRQNTQAEKLPDDVPIEKKEERHQLLLSLCNKLAEEKNLQFVEKIVKVLVEYIDGDRASGKTRDNRGVSFNGDKSLVGKIVSVKIKKAKVHSLIGELS